MALSATLVLVSAGVVWSGFAAPPADARAGTIEDIVPDVPTGATIVPPASAHAANLPYQGGPVLHSNRTHVIFWQPTGSGLAFDPGYQSLIERFLEDVAAASRTTTNLYSISGQYWDSHGHAVYDSTYGGAVLATDPLPPNGCQEPITDGPGWTVCLTEAQLESELVHVIAVDHLPTAGNDIYFLVMPNGLGSCTDSSSTSCALGGSATGYCGYHSQTPSGVLFAVIPYNAVPGHCQSGNPRPNSSTADPTLSTIAHEQNETVTDPYGDAWINADGYEEADLCLTSFGSPIGGSGAAAYNQSINGGHFYLQELWSNANGSCQQRAKPDTVSFKAERPAGKPSMEFFAHGSDPEPRAAIVKFHWFFGGRSAAHGPRVTHDFKRDGFYRVVLRTTDSWGNWTYYARTIRVSGSGSWRHRSPAGRASP